MIGVRKCTDVPSFFLSSSFSFSVVVLLPVQQTNIPKRIKCEILSIGRAEWRIASGSAIRQVDGTVTLQWDCDQVQEYLSKLTRKVAVRGI